MFSRGQEGFGKRKINMKALVYNEWFGNNIRENL